MEKPNNKTGISPTTLGRERNRYHEMKQIDGVTKKQIDAQMKIDAKRYAKKLGVDVSYENYKYDIETVPVKGAGKRESDIAERDTLIMETQELNAGNNLAILSEIGEVTLSDSAKVKAFDAIGYAANQLAQHLTTGFDNYGAMTMDHAIDGLLCVHIAGWEDGSKKLRYQYAPRKLPISKRSGYRDDSLVAPVMDVPTDTVPETPEE